MKVLRILTTAMLITMLNSPHVFAQGSSTAASTPASAKAANRLLAKSVRRALGRVKGLDPTRIYVKASNGAITLAGNLRNQAQIDLAQKTAEGVEGVVSVENRIVIFNEGDN
jgi:osmotically-inducible protein OsmY